MEPTPSIRVIGAGPAGSAAAVAALRAGAQVELFEKSHFPRHKVCGEFLSPEILPLLESLAVLNDFTAAQPATIRRLALHFPSADKICQLPEPAFGLSRYALDDLLFRKAVTLGAHPHLESGSVPGGSPTVVAHGRNTASSRGGRLFGFKAHFDGPATDAIELYFFDRCYVGINAIEGGVTNVCGLGPEDFLGKHDFDIDAVVSAAGKLSERLRPMRRKFRWLTAGPLVFQNRFRENLASGQYPAGDALSFVDPFTGSGMLSAILSGRLAGLAATRGDRADAYLGECRRSLEKPFQVAAMFRSLLANGWGERLAGWIPGRLLVSLTRPHRVMQ